ARSSKRAPVQAPAPLIIVPVSVAGEQPMGTHTRDIDQLQDNMGRHSDAGLVVVPGLNPYGQGIGQELGAVFSAQVFANLPEACGQFRPHSTIRAVALHDCPPQGSLPSPCQPSRAASNPTRNVAE